MSAFRPRTTRLGGLPNISYILWKPKPLGTEFKTSVCPKLNVMTYMELCEGKDGMKSRPFHTKLGGTTACAVRMSQGTCQTDLDNKIEVVKGDLWFGSVKTVLSIKEHCPKCKEAVFQVKTAHKLFPKQFLEEVLKDAPGGMSLKLLSTYQGVHLIAVGFKYNKRKHVLHFIMTENAGSTGPGNLYEMKFADQHGNVCICEVSRPEVISEFFDDCNCVDVHNQLRQYAI
jgi:hypothetical protein